MNCTEFEAAVERAIESREPIAEDLFAHTTTCSTCRNVLELHQQLDAAIDAWRLATPPSGLVNSVLLELSEPSWSEDSAELRILLGLDEFKTNQTKAEPAFVVRSKEPVVRRKTRTSALTMSSIAACLFVGVVLITSYSGNNAIQQRNRLEHFFQNQTGNLSKTESSGVSSKLTELLTDLRSEYREIASETTSAAKEIVNVIPQRVAASIIAETNEITNEIELLPTSSDVTRMWQPIGSRVGTALSFLLQAVPSEFPSG